MKSLIVILKLFSLKIKFKFKNNPFDRLQHSKISKETKRIQQIPTKLLKNLKLPKFQ